MKRYEKVSVFERWDGKRVYKPTLYPKIQPSDTDIVIISNESDYLDSLANKYYKDPTLWYIIALANGIGMGKMSVEPGLQLRIPTNIHEIISEFERLNK